MHINVLKEGKYEQILSYFRGYKFELDCSSYPATHAFQIFSRYSEPDTFQ